MKKRRIKILQFPIANSNGGITHYILNNWKWMDKEKFQCDFATMSKHLDFAEEILATGSNIYYISCYAENNREQFIQEFEYILENDYDVVHLHTKQWKSFLAEDICRKYYVPKVIVHSHNTGIDVPDLLEQKREMELHEQVKTGVNESIATDFWACSELAADFLFGKQIPREKIEIMVNAIELEQFIFCQKKYEKYRKAYGLKDCFVIGHVGRFEYSKNHKFLIKVFLEVCRKIKNAKLLLIGTGKLEKNIHHMVEELGLSSKVLFMGKRTDVSELLQIMDVFCLPSRFEGLGIAFIEAQAMGLPSIVSDTIPKEAVVNENVKVLPLAYDIWIDEVIKSRYSLRVKNQMRLKQKGYDIKDQIKQVEEKYAGGHNTL